MGDGLFIQLLFGQHELGRGPRAVQSFQDDEAIENLWDAAHPEFSARRLSKTDNASIIEMDRFVMVAVLLALLLVGILARAPAQEAEQGSPPRFLQLPDITLSAEDPLYLSPPPAAGWSEALVEQPALDRLMLSPAEIPSPVLPAPELLAALSFVQLSLPADPRVTAPGSRQPSQSLLPVGIPVRKPKTWEYGAEFRHVFAESTVAGLRLDGDLGSWTLSGDGAGTLTDASPSMALLQLQAIRPSQPWGGNLNAGATAVFCSDAFLAADLEAGAGLALEGERLRFRAQTKTRIERWRVDAGFGGWISQELAVDSSGRGFGLYGSALASLLSSPAADLRPDGLARLGISWKGQRIPLDLSAGGGLLYYGQELAGYPEAGIELRLAPSLRIKTWLGPFLEEPIRLAFRAVNDPSNESGLHSQGGIAVKGSVLLDLPRIGGVEATVQASDGFRYRLREQALHWERARELQLDLESSWTIVPGWQRRPGITFQSGASASLPLPPPEQPLAHLICYDLDAGIGLTFPSLPLDLMIQGHWGDFPLQAEQALITRRLSLFSGWMASLLVRGGQEQKLAWFAGVEVRQPAEVRAVLGWATHTGIGQ